MLVVSSHRPARIPQPVATTATTAVRRAVVIRLATIAAPANTAISWAGVTTESTTRAASTAKPTTRPGSKRGDVTGVILSAEVT